MTAWQIAKQWQDKNSSKDFYTAVCLHMATGLVFVTPQIFLLAREVFWNNDSKTISSDEDTPNAWFVELGASSGHKYAIKEFMRVAPRPHKWAVWCRRGESRARAFDWSQLAKKVRL